ncbi:MAG: hypothetical protein R2879_08230 [Saprospiraceae bacterium]
MAVGGVALAAIDFAHDYMIGGKTGNPGPYRCNTYSTVLAVMTLRIQFSFPYVAEPWRGTEAE